MGGGDPASLLLLEEYHHHHHQHHHHRLTTWEKKLFYTPEIKDAETRTGSFSSSSACEVFLKLHPSWICCVFCPRRLGRGGKRRQRRWRGGEKRRRRGSATAAAAAAAEVLPACAPSLHLPSSSPLSLLSPHPTSGEPEGYRQRAKHSGSVRTCTQTHTKHNTTQHNTGWLAARQGAPAPLLFCHPPSPSPPPPHSDVLSSPS